MKKSALRKDILREIKKSQGRFLSIFAIVAIGVAFFAGVNASVPIMKGSADHYFDEYNLMDFKLQSTLGMSEDDVDAIEKIKGVEGVYPSYTMDAITTLNNAQKVVKVMSFPLLAKTSDQNYINQMRLMKGRLPKNANECVIESGTIKGIGLGVGDKITLTSGTDDDIIESLKKSEYTIVGEVTSPYYLSYEKGSSSIGSGTIDSYIYVADVNFKIAAFTEIYVTVKGAKDYNSYDDAYFDYIENVANEITSIKEERAHIRFSEIQKEALQKIEDGRKEYEENKKKFDNEIAAAQTTLDNGYAQIVAAQSNLNTNKVSSEQMFSQKETDIKQGEEQLKQMKAQYESGKTQLEKQKEQTEEQRAKMNQQLLEAKTQKAVVDTQLQQIVEKLDNPNLSIADKERWESEKQEAETKQNIILSTIQTLQQQMAELKYQVDIASSQLTTLESQIPLVESQLTTGKQQLEEARTRAETEFKKAQQQIDDGNTNLREGRAELETKQNDGEEKLAEAKEKLDKSEENIKDMETAKWYVLDRQSHYSYMDYGSAADRMGGIAKVFPLFFFLVAALVCLTTMTRMVDEQRQEIGTLKALGYERGYIAMKYIAYAGLASIAGGIFGAVTGMTIFPTIIYNAWNIMYALPEVHLEFLPGMAFMAIAIVSLITIAAATFAVYKELLEVPSQLMRPKSPKNGKKILLERIPVLWKHFDFIYKVTARNIFRYKKRFLMTVIGISGCTALLLAGFGIRDSIGEIVTLQYGEINKYDVSMTYDSDSSASQREAALKELKTNVNVKDVMGIGVYHGSYADGGEDKGVTIYVPSDLAKFEEFVTLRTRKGHHSLQLSNNGVILTEKLAKLKGVAVGDTIAINTGSGKKQKVTIMGICENYVGHAIYMTPSYFKTIFHESTKDSGVLGILKNHEPAIETELGNTFMKVKGIDSLTFYSGIQDSFASTISSLSFIVVVLIICAGILAFIVLYNLTNVNISERLREIATIKVLGFYDREVSSYVYRENIFLTLIGSFTGLALGVALHALIMNLAEMETVMFGRNIYFLSFLYSILITMGFSVIVNFVMYPKLKKIPMVESLKSVE